MSITFKNGIWTVSLQLLIQTTTYVNQIYRLGNTKNEELQKKRYATHTFSEPFERVFCPRGIHRIKIKKIWKLVKEYEYCVRVCIAYGRHLNPSTYLYFVAWVDYFNWIARSEAENSWHKIVHIVNGIGRLCSGAFQRALHAYTHAHSTHNRPFSKYLLNEFRCQVNVFSVERGAFRIQLASWAGLKHNNVEVYWFDCFDILEYRNRTTNLRPIL